MWHRHWFSRRSYRRGDDALLSLLAMAGLACGAVWLVRRYVDVLWPFAAGVAGFFLVLHLGRWLRARHAFARAQQLAQQLAGALVESYRIDPCVTCYDDTFIARKFSSLGRALQYECAGCAKRRWVPALVPDTAALVELDERRAYHAARCAHHRRDPAFEVPVVGTVAPAPLPFEQVRREVIPPDLRRYVLERDHWRCRSCGTATDLQLDHIIAVTNGGATSRENLQVLCGACNRKKGARA